MDYMLVPEKMKLIYTNGKKLFKFKQSEKTPFNQKILLGHCFQNVCGYFEPQSSTCKIKLSKHQYLPSWISSAHHSPDPLLPWPMKEYELASPSALPSQIIDCPFHYPFPLFTKLLHVLQLSLLKFCMYPNIRRAVEHGQFLLQQKSCGQTNSDSTVL